MKGAALLAALVAAPALAHHVELLPPLQFVPPPPGSYQLHRIMPAPDGRVLDVDGRAARLSQYLHDRITLLGFIYTTCADPDGCPLAYRVFDALKEAIAATPRLQGQVRFVTLSFDPARDTPEAMRRYAGSRVVEGDGACAGISSPPVPRVSCFRWWRDSGRTSALRPRAASCRTCSRCS